MTVFMDFASLVWRHIWAQNSLCGFMGHLHHVSDHLITAMGIGRAMALRCSTRETTSTTVNVTMMARCVVGARQVFACKIFASNIFLAFMLVLS